MVTEIIIKPEPRMIAPLIVQTYEYVQDGVRQIRVQSGYLARGRVKNIKSAIPVTDQRTGVNGCIANRPNTDRAVTWMHPSAVHHGCECDRYEVVIIRDGVRLMKKSTDMGATASEVVEALLRTAEMLLRGEI